MASQDWFEKDFYAVLGTAKDVTQDELRKVYRKLARKYHPDSNAGDPVAEAKFKEISEAYSVLGDAEQRAEYDQMRAMGAGGARFGGGAGGFEDVFSGFGGGGGQRIRFGQGNFGQAGFEDIFSGMFGGGQGAGFGQPRPGADLTANTTIDFQQAVNGDTVTLQSSQGKQITVKIPAGVKDGQKIKLRGKGQPSPEGGAAGDLLITVHVRPHPVFTREAANLRVEVPVTFTEAALGATIEVPTLEGKKVKMKVPAGTPSGRVLRLKGKGLTTAKGVGDLLVVVQVAVPSHLSDAAREALEAFAAVEPGENPRDELLRKAGV